MIEKKPEQTNKARNKKSFPKWIFPLIASVLMICIFTFLAVQIVCFVGAGEHKDENIFSAMVKGYDAGKKEGLSAKDTEQQIQNTVEGMGKLEVLVANVKIPEYHSVGKKFAAMYLFRGSAVFTVDLSETKIIVKNSDVQVLVPKPIAEVKIDNKETERIKSKSALFFNGSTEEGLEAYLNTLKAVDKVSTEQISNFPELNEMAKQAAKLQLNDIIENICGNDKNITFSFIEE
ncbi:hypothetical protein SAMN02910436_02849 [Ruminococcaceae bacterium P7]|nr:hypothetical protein SAMN02910436_02849 [Ruminococcaceae bacterium P7]